MLLPARGAARLRPAAPHGGPVAGRRVAGANPNPVHGARSVCGHLQGLAGRAVREVDCAAGVWAGHHRQLQQLLRAQGGPRRAEFAHAAPRAPPRTGAASGRQALSVHPLRTLSGSPGTIHRRAGPGRAVRTEWRGRSGFDALGARAGCVAAAHQCCRCLAPSRRLALAPGRPGCAASEGAPARVCIQREVAAALGSRSKPWPRRLCPPLGAAGRRRRTARPASGCAWCRTCAASRCSAPSS